MGQVREALRYHHYAYRTEQTYCHWILRYIHHFGVDIHPNRLDTKNNVMTLFDIAQNYNLYS